MTENGHRAFISYGTQEVRDDLARIHEINVRRCSITFNRLVMAPFAGVLVRIVISGTKRFCAVRSDCANRRS